VWELRAIVLSPVPPPALPDGPPGPHVTFSDPADVGKSVKAGKAAPKASGKGKKGSVAAADAPPPPPTHTRSVHPVKRWSQGAFNPTTWHSLALSLAPAPAAAAADGVEAAAAEEGGGEAMSSLVLDGDSKRAAPLPVPPPLPSPSPSPLPLPPAAAAAAAAAGGDAAIPPAATDPSLASLAPLAAPMHVDEADAVAWALPPPPPPPATRPHSPLAPPGSNGALLGLGGVALDTSLDASLDADALPATAGGPETNMTALAEGSDAVLSEALAPAVPTSLGVVVRVGQPEPPPFYARPVQPLPSPVAPAPAPAPAPAAAEAAADGDALLEALEPAAAPSAVPKPIVPEVEVAFTGAVKAVAVAGAGDVAAPGEVTALYADWGREQQAWEESKARAAAAAAAAAVAAEAAAAAAAAAAVAEEAGEGAENDLAAAAAAAGAGAPSRPAVPDDCEEVAEVAVTLVCGHGELGSDRVLLPKDVAPGKYVLEVVDGVAAPCLRVAAGAAAVPPAFLVGPGALAGASVAVDGGGPSVLLAGSRSLLTASASIDDPTSLLLAPGAAAIAPGGGAAGVGVGSAVPSLDDVRHMARVARPVQTNTQIVFYVDAPGV